MNNLTIILDQDNAVAVFTSDAMDETLNKIEEEVLSLVPDTGTEKGRKEIASLANKVAKSKVALDNAGKTLTTDWKAKSKLVDTSRKNARDFLDNLKIKVRQPLTEWEDAEVIKIDKARIKAEIEADHIDALTMNDLFNREKVIAEKERVIVEQKAEKERIETEERIAAEKIEHERKLKEQAAEQARLKAEQEAQNKIDEAKRIEAEAKAETEKLKREKVEAENKAKFDAEQAESNRLQAIKDAEIAKENAIKLEQFKAKQKAERVEQDRLNIVAEEERQAEIKASNLQHQKEVNNEVLKVFTDSGIDADYAKGIIKVIIKSRSQFITINY